MVQKKKIVIIDDHPLFREGLKTIIGRCSNFCVVGEAGSGHEGLEIAKKLQPDVVLIDLSLPDRDGLKIIRELRSLLPAINIMVVSMHSKIDYITEAFRAGARGYVVKGSASGNLLQGLESLISGEYFLDSSVPQDVGKKLMAPLLNEKSVTDISYKDLTIREQEILRLRAEGFSIKEIGEKLFISPKTAENHCNNLMKKLNLHSLVDVIRYAAKFGLIDIDSWKE